MERMTHSAAPDRCICALLPELSSLQGSTQSPPKTQFWLALYHRGGTLKFFRTSDLCIAIRFWWWLDRVTFSFSWSLQTYQVLIFPIVLWHCWYNSKLQSWAYFILLEADQKAVDISCCSWTRYSATFQHHHHLFHLMMKNPLRVLNCENRFTWLFRNNELRVRCQRRQ